MRYKQLRITNVIMKLFTVDNGLISTFAVITKTRNLYNYEVVPGFHIFDRQEICNGFYRVIPDLFPPRTCLC